MASLVSSGKAGQRGSTEIFLLKGHSQYRLVFTENLVRTFEKLKSKRCLTATIYKTRYIVSASTFVRNTLQNDL